MTSFFRRLLGSGLPDGFAGTLEHDEHVLAVAAPLVATSRGLWVPDGDGVRRIGWHLISKATWAAGALSVTESVESDTAGSAVVLEDKQTERYGLSAPGKLPQVVHARVTGSIRTRHHHDLPGGGAWFVQRKVPGQDGIVLQVRPDRGADLAVVRRLAAEVSARMPHPNQ
jgi:hypothetical protein